MGERKWLFTVAVAVATLTFTAGTVLTPKSADARNASIKSGLSDTELDLIFGKNRPSKIGPHDIYYLSEAEAKEVKGKLAPLVIAVVGGVAGAGAGAASAWVQGGSWSDIGYGAGAGAIGGFFGGAIGVAVGGATGGFVGSVAGGFYEGAASAACAGCHESKSGKRVSISR